MPCWLCLYIEIEICLISKICYAKNYLTSYVLPTNFTANLQISLLLALIIFVRALFLL